MASIDSIAENLRHLDEFARADTVVHRLDPRAKVVVTLAFVVTAVGAYYIIKMQWVKHALAVSSIVAIIGIIFLAWDNKYMDFAPNFEKTITHTVFDNLLEATYKLEDISSMERVNRWMAGIEMIQDRFWMGFGPGTFYSNYKSYSISRFQTYVSDNPDQSGIHIKLFPHDMGRTRIYRFYHFHLLMLCTAY